MKHCPAVIVLTIALTFTACHRQSVNANKNDDRPNKNTSHDAGHQLDLNSATKAELAGLPGIGDVYADRIIAHRPFHDKGELVRKKIIPESTYEHISDRIIARQN